MNRHETADCDRPGRHSGNAQLACGLRPRGACRVAGTGPVGGVMPGFADILQQHEIRATVGYFQSFRSDEIYAQWQEIDRRKDFSGE